MLMKFRDNLFVFRDYVYFFFDERVFLSCFENVNEISFKKLIVMENLNVIMIFKEKEIILFILILLERRKKCE